MFEVHILNDEGKKKATYIAGAFCDLLGSLSVWCPESREMSIVKTKLEEACFFAKKAMASQAENQEAPSVSTDEHLALIRDIALGKQ